MRQIISLSRTGKTNGCAWGRGKAREKYVCMYVCEIMHNLFYFVYNLKSVNFFAAARPSHKNI